jgi:fatty-acyl-CoA synthase
LSLLGDLATLREAGILRPLGPRTTLELGRQILREGIKSHLVYTLHATRDPNRAALIYEDRVWTWAQHADRVRRIANHLIAWGVRPGDSVAIMLPNRPEFIEADAAARRIGATTAYVNPRAPAAEARALIGRTKAGVLVTHRDDVHANARVLFVPKYYEGAIAAAPSGEPRPKRGPEGKVVIFTSGTTGRPKGAVRAFDEGLTPGLLAGFLRTLPFRTSDVHMVVCPLYHSSGSGFAGIAHMLGNPLVIVERFSPEAFCRHVQEHKVTTTAVVPTMLHQIAEWPGARDYDLSSLRVVVCTGAPLREEVRAEARDLIGDVVYDLYGSTEMGWVSVASPDDQLRKPGTVGKPVPGIEIAIVDDESRRVPAGRPGEIWVASKLGMRGYLDDPQLDSERMREGWISVRDIGYLDEDGYLHVVDRADDMIISGGVNVYPAETEVALGSHPNVTDCAVVGVPDPKWGQRIVAAVVARGDVTPDALIDWCKEHASYASVPKEVRFFDSLPRNDIGKIDKRKIKEGWQAS